MWMKMSCLSLLEIVCIEVLFGFCFVFKFDEQNGICYFLHRLPEDGLNTRNALAHSSHRKLPIVTKSQD